MTIAVLLFAAALLALGSVAALAFWPWRVEATVKAMTNESAISLAAGIELAGLSASGGAVLDGPGLVAIRFGKRALYKRSIAKVSVDAFLAWLDAWLTKPATPKGAVGRLADRAKSFLLARTDTSELPELGLRVLSSLQDASFEGAITCGFRDPALTGKTAALLFPIAGVLAPFGMLDVSCDWSGKTRIDGEANVRFRFVPARVAGLGLLFAWHHVRLRSRPALVSRTMALPETT